MAMKAMKAMKAMRARPKAKAMKAMKAHPKAKAIKAMKAMAAMKAMKAKKDDGPTEHQKIEMACQWEKVNEKLKIFNMNNPSQPFESLSRKDQVDVLQGIFERIAQ